MKINLSNGDFQIEGVTFNKNFESGEFEHLIKNNENNFQLFSSEGGVYQYTAQDNDELYTIWLQDQLLQFIQLEYSANDNSWEEYEANKDVRIEETKKILSDMGLSEKNSFDWGTIEYFYDPRNISPMIIVNYF